MTGSSLFTHINESFDCEQCGLSVPPAETGCRNHCPHCLSSKHVDINPGDRRSTCLGTLRAITYEVSPKKGLVLIFKCDRCGAVSRNKALRTGVSPDDYDKILALKPTLG
ncbi:MAG: RNHCP domain-containing protein [Proteobacteria bacterium]|nr:RNHCP domain-containing protein [Pseudomonadota bacterium]